MSPWLSTLRDRVRRGDRKDAALVVLSLLLVLVSGVALRDRLAALAGGPGVAGAEAVEVFDVVVDREARLYADFLFDHSLGRGHEGEVLETPPATIEPALAGVWRWRDAAVLRFEPAGGFPMASQYSVAFIPDRLVGEGQRLAGRGRFELRTDQFLVEGVDLIEEPVPEGRGLVVLRGTVRFNYPVDPEQLAPRIRLLDPRQGRGAESIPVLLE